MFIIITSTVKKRISKAFGNNCNTLDLNGFIEFYRQVCMDRPECVWLNLNKFGYGNDLQKSKKYNDREVLAMEKYEQERMNLHYSGRYYADFSIDQLLERFNYDCNVRPSIVGKPKNSNVNINDKNDKNMILVIVNVIVIQTMEKTSTTPVQRREDGAKRWVMRMSRVKTPRKQNDVSGQSRKVF